MAGSPIFSENFTNRKNSAVLNYHDPYRDPDRHPDQTSRFCGISISCFCWSGVFGCSLLFSVQSMAWQATFDVITSWTFMRPPRKTGGKSLYALVPFWSWACFIITSTRQCWIVFHRSAPEGNYRDWLFDKQICHLQSQKSLYISFILTLRLQIEVLYVWKRKINGRLRAKHLVWTLRRRTNKVRQVYHWIDHARKESHGVSKGMPNWNVL